MSDELPGEFEVEKKEILSKIIKRLVKTDQVLILISDEGTKMDRKLKLHPSIV